MPWERLNKVWVQQGGPLAGGKQWQDQLVPASTSLAHAQHEKGALHTHREGCLKGNMGSVSWTRAQEATHSGQTQALSSAVPFLLPLSWILSQAGPPVTLASTSP